MTSPLHPDIIATIAQKLANQIVAFQSAIEARPQGQQFPTPQEANQQHKLITCLLRLVKQPAKPRKEKLHTPADIEALNSWAKVANEIMATPIATESDPPEIRTHTAPKTTTTAVTQRDFEQYGHQLGKSAFANLTDKTTIKFNGRYVNAKWLQYNLFQYCLPLEQRNFIEDARNVIAQVDHHANCEKIEEFLAQKNKMAA
jgi:hypothetical protein